MEASIHAANVMGTMAIGMALTRPTSARRQSTKAAISLGCRTTFESLVSTRSFAAWQIAGQMLLSLGLVAPRQREITIRESTSGNRCRIWLAVDKAGESGSADATRTSSGW